MTPRRRKPALTPRQKWDRGIKLTGRELDELLAEGPIAEQLLAFLGTGPKTPAEISAHLGAGFPVERLEELLQHLASDPVWLARATAEGWVLGHGEEPPPPAPQRPPGASIIPAAPPAPMVLLKGAGLASLADDGPLASGAMTSSYSRLLATPPAPASPTMSLRIDPATADLQRAIVLWGAQFSGKPWATYAPRLKEYFADFLRERYPWLLPDAVALCCTHVRVVAGRVNIDVPALQRRIAELAPRSDAPREPRRFA